MQIDYVKVSCKEDVHVCCTNFAKKMERNSHGTTSQWKTYRKRLFSEDLEVRDASSVVDSMLTTFLYLNFSRLSGLQALFSCGIATLS
jgi:hypothetical protein